MANHSSGDQISYILQWFNTWSDFQKDDFVHVIAPKVSSNTQVNGIVNGLQNLDTSGRPPSLFACQVKLFNEWWTNWNEADREKMLNQLKNVDGKFWSEVEAEISGTRKKMDEDFFTVTITNNTSTTETTVSPVPEKSNDSNGTISNNNNTECDLDGGEVAKDKVIPEAESDVKNGGPTAMDTEPETKIGETQIQEETSPVDL